MKEKDLNQYYSLNLEIENLEEQLSELHEREIKAIKMTGMPGSGGTSDSVGKLASEIVDLSDLINLKLKECIIARNRIERFIASIQDSEMRLILRMRHIDRKSWEEIGDKLGYHLSTVAKKHKAFINNSKISNNKQNIIQDRR